MEGEKSGVPNYELQVSFTTPQAIHEMGFVQFEENQVLSFLAPPNSQSSQISQPTANTALGFGHNEQVLVIIPFVILFFGFIS